MSNVNPRRMRAARVTVVVPCVCVCASVCLFVVFCHHAYLDPKIIIGMYMYVFTVTREKLYNRDFCLKCLVQKLRHHLLALDATNYTLTPNDGYQRNQLKVGKPLIVPILTENASLRSYSTFAYLLHAHIRNINMRRYTTSAHGHELSGRVRAHAYI